MKHCSYCGCMSPDYVQKCIGCYRKLTADRVVFLVTMTVSVVLFMA